MSEGQSRAKYAEILGALTLPVKMLLDEYPPIFGDKKKRVFFEREQDAHKNDSGAIRVSRWCFYRAKTFPLGELKNTHTKITINDDKHYRYTDAPTLERNVWWMNFSSFLLFGLYGSDLFSQDKVQVLEHPLLGAVAEFLDESDVFGLEPETSVETNINPLPFLLENVPQWFDINGNVTQDGKTYSIYGEHFCTTPMETLEKAITPSKSGGKHNFIAAAAPCDGQGEYTDEELKYAVQVALSSFGAARQMDRLHGYEKTTIHTGNWGCGSFHNNYELIYVCQLLASELAGIDEIVFHRPHTDDLEAAKSTLAQLSSLGNNAKLDDIVEFLEDKAYRWAV